MLRALPPAIAALALAACAGGADFDPSAQVPVQDSYAALPAEFGPANDDWIAAFNDTQLVALVDQALENNPNVEAARAGLAAARAQARIANAGRLPTLNANFRAAETEGGMQSGSSFSLGLDAGWQADVWGRLTDQARAGYLNAEAAEADWRGARLSIAAATARAWFSLTEASLQTALSRQDVDTRERQLNIVERRFQRGVARSSDVRTARSALASSRAALASRERAEAAAARQLETLIADYPDASIAAANALPELGALPYPGAPQGLVTRRPDIVAAEARLEAAGYSADAARKALYPSLSLSASITDSARDLEDVLDFDNLVSQVAASILAPIFRGGQLRAQADQAQAQARQQAARYVDTVLTALREAENAIDADLRLNERVAALAEAAEEAQAALELVERQYASGVATIFELIDAQTRLINADSQLIAARAARVDNRVGLHLAVAGDFEAGGGYAPATETDD
ncbi:MAG: efflux transporter outer membrane subunit [Oceanicaulis sp.]